MKNKNIFFLLLVCIIVSGCDKKKGHIEGPRLSVLGAERELVPDKDAEIYDVSIEEPVLNENWPQVGGSPSHMMPHLTLGDGKLLSWTADVGQGSKKGVLLVAGPISHDGKVFTLNSAGDIYAIDIESGKTIWSIDTIPTKNEKPYSGGGLAAEGDVLVAATPYGQLFSIDVKDGKINWVKNLSALPKSPPTIFEGRIFLVLKGNRAVAYALKDGDRLWVHEGGDAASEIIGGAPPAASDSAVAIPYSTGEIHVLRAENGYPLMVQNMSSENGSSSQSFVNHVRARPVISGKHLIAVSNSGLTTVFDWFRGERVWEKSVGGTHTPAVTSHFIFLLSNNDELSCLTKGTGKVLWTVDVANFAEQKLKLQRVGWSGPVLAGNKLFVVGSNGEVLTFSPTDGSFLGMVDLPGQVYLSPIVVKNKIIFLSDEGLLMALE